MHNAQPELTEKDENPLPKVIGTISGIICTEAFPNGERAALKRMSAEGPPPIAFYRFAIRHLPERWEKDQPAWRTILSGMALMSPNIHNRNMPFGKALAEHKYAEARLERLLAADQAIQRTLLLRAIRFLKPHKIAVDWYDIARLLLFRDPKKQEQIHMKIANDYYRNLTKKDQ